MGSLILAGALVAVFPKVHPAAGAVTGSRLDRLPLCFVENRGQVDQQVAYYLQGRDTSIYFTSRGLTFAFRERSQRSVEGHDVPDPASWSERYVLKLDFVDALEGAPEGRTRSPAVISYFKGSRDQWRAGLSTYRSIVYAGLWPGIDLIYSGAGNRMKYQFVVSPGADPERIRLAYRGATGLTLNAAGELAVATPAGSFNDDAPYAYQEGHGRRVDVTARYVLNTRTREHPNAFEYGFELGEYDRTRPLVLDPAVLVYAGFIGGSDNEGGMDIAVDDFGNAYVTGYTFSTEATFPETVGPDLTLNGPGTSDAFVAKIAADGAGLLYAGFLGGAGEDGGFGIDVDDGGNAYVTGYTRSGEGTFPVTGGPDLSANGGQDAFVAKVNPEGTGLVYAGYLGGGADDAGIAVVADDAGNAYVTGLTQSNGASFPVKEGPDLTFNEGGVDGFVAKVRSVPTDPMVTNNLEFCGYIGGDGNDQPQGIALDAADRLYVAGYTGSHETTFPVVTGPDLGFNGSVSDAFVARLRAVPDNPTVTGNYDFCGYIGGADGDVATDVAVDSAGSAYVVGLTASREATFPETVGPDLTFNEGGFGQDAFVAKVNPEGTGLVYAGYIGGANTDWAYGIAVDGAGSAYVFGHTLSSQSSFPVTVGPDLTISGGQDTYVAKVKPLPNDPVALKNFDYCGYVGGVGLDSASKIAVDDAGGAYLTGYTRSTEATFPALLGPDLTHNGGPPLTPGDAFVAKIVSIVPAPPSAPTNLQGTAVTSAHVELSWQDNSSNELGFRIYRADAGTVDIAAGAETYADRSVTASTRYTYEVRAFNAAGESPPSNAVELTTPRAGKLVVSPRTVKFRTTIVAGSSTKTLKILNSGKGPLEGTVDYTDPPFEVTANGGDYLLMPRKSRVVELTFTPRGAGLSAGELWITSSDPAKPSVRVPLTGKGR